MTIDQISLPIIVYRKTAVVTIYPRLYWFLDIGFHYTRDSSDTPERNGHNFDFT